MTPKQRAVEALNRRVPDEVPTFELEFQLEDEMFGHPFDMPEYSYENRSKLSAAEQRKLIEKYVEYKSYVYRQLDYCIIPAYSPFCTWDDWEGGRMSEEYKLFLRLMREAAGGRAMLGSHGDCTFAIPDGTHMYDFVYWLADDPDGVKREAQHSVEVWKRNNAALHEAGIEVSLHCSDYCYNSGPFLSPEMMAEFVTPYLSQNIANCRADGMFVIKHTDGNIMPILDQLVDANPHALHSIDPMAGVDIREVKRLVGDRVALCGNVHCAALQTGTDDEVRESAEYCLTYAKPNGGYIFCTSNVPFHGMPPERYTMILDIWKKMRGY